ncbi:MAG TPA: hypothetical protein VMW46_02875, partial [Candidatus Desulfaltia sp.]|nr:hypothetical protein [Candidatus Desulfaltia sp.]
TATIRVAATGVPNKDITATEQDNDTLQFVTSVDTVSVPEGNTATFQVRLSAQPSATVNVTVSRVSGDTDITVQSGAALTFTTANWNTNQPVTLAAAEDADIANGTATIRVAATGVPNKDITATEQDNDTLQFVTSVDTVSVPEGNTATFQVRLSAQPSATVNVTVSRASGDTDITVQSGAALTFTTANWNTDQPVTLAAAEDADTLNDTATIRISATGVPNKDITATELDDDGDNGTISLVLDPSLSPEGTLFDTTVEISGNAETVSVFGLDLVYNATFFTYKDKEPGTLTANWTITVDSSTAGLLKVRGVGGTTIPVSSSGSLVKVILQVNCLSYTTPTVTTLWLDNYTDDLLDEFLPLPSSSDFTFYPCARLGDVNNDGNVTPGDAQSAFEIYLGRITPTLCQVMTSDANCSLGTTPGDAQDIFEHYLGILTLPLCCALAGSVSARIASSKSFSALEETQILALDRGARPSEFPRSIERARNRRDDARFRRTLYALDTIGRPGQTANVPVVVSNSKDLRSFAFDVIYPTDMLEYLDAKRTSLTREFDYVLGTEEVPGLVHIEAESQEPIPGRDFGGLVILMFRVKEGAEFGLPLQVLNPVRDLRDAELAEGMFVRSESPGTDLRWVSLGNPLPADNSLIRIPVHLNDLFGLKAFGFEVRYGLEKLTFAGIRRPDQDEGFIDLQAREVEPGRLRVGGFRISEDLRREPGLLVELIFKKKAGGGEINLEALVDDLSRATITRGNLRLD